MCGGHTEVVLGKANRLELMELGDEAPGGGRGPRDERRAEAR